MKSLFFDIIHNFKFIIMTKSEANFKQRILKITMLSAIMIVLVSTTVALENINAQGRYKKVVGNGNNAKFQLMELPYPTDALAPVISKETIELHHGKHLKGYVDNLNKLIVGTKFEKADLITIVKESDGAIFNNAGQILNHNLYFAQFTANPDGEPKGRLRKAIDATWGSFETFQASFEQAGATVFGSGWVWLATDKKGNLQIVIESNGGNPITKGLKPIFGIDLWEHAYYLDYQNRRADHIKAIWNIVSWKEVGKRY